MGDKDVDAQFADIIAHWDDVESLAEPTRSDHGSPQPDPSEAGPSQAGPSDARPSDAHPSDAGLGAPGAGPTGPGPSRDDEATGHVNESPLMGFPVWRGATAPSPGAPDAPGAPGAEGLPPADDEEHFEPGPTAPLPPQDDLHFWGIVVGLVGGPLLLLWLVIFPPGLGSWWGLLAMGLTAAGFILLVLRQPASRDDDDPDNGARV